MQPLILYKSLKTALKHHLTLHKCLHTTDSAAQEDAHEVDGDGVRHVVQDLDARERERHRGADEDGEEHEPAGRPSELALGTTSDTN